VVYSNKGVWKYLTKLNSTPAMDFVCEERRKHRYTQMKDRTKQTNIIVISVLLLICQCLCDECVLLLVFGLGFLLLFLKCIFVICADYECDLSYI